MCLQSQKVIVVHWVPAGLGRDFASTNLARFTTSGHSSLQPLFSALLFCGEKRWCNGVDVVAGAVTE